MSEVITMMMKKKLLVVGGVVAALAVPAGVAVATADTPPADDSPSTEVDRPGSGPHGRMMGGFGDREDCPFYDSEAMQQWHEQREEWRQQHRDERGPQGDGWQQHRQERDQHREQMREHMKAPFDESR
jgi:Spy/CpxP family protein refolding chaperone